MRGWGQALGLRSTVKSGDVGEKKGVETVEEPSGSFHNDF